MNKIKTTRLVALLGALCLGLPVGSLITNAGCPNSQVNETGSTADCSTAQQCSNHTSDTTCTTAVTIVSWLSGTRTMYGKKVNQVSTACETDVDCMYSNGECSVCPGSDGDTHNAQKNTTASC